MFSSMKPLATKEFLIQNDGSLLHKIVISIAAGITLSFLQQYSPSAKFHRAMPNTPCQIRQGMTVISRQGDPQSLDLVQSIFEPLGRCMVLPDELFDAVTAISGSGPAFVWYASFS